MCFSCGSKPQQGNQPVSPSDGLFATGSGEGKAQGSWLRILQPTDSDAGPWENGHIVWSNPPKGPSLWARG